MDTPRKPDSKVASKAEQEPKAVNDTINQTFHPDEDEVEEHKESTIGSPPVNVSGPEARMNPVNLNLDMVEISPLTIISEKASPKIQLNRPIMSIGGDNSLNESKDTPKMGPQKKDTTTSSKMKIV